MLGSSFIGDRGFGHSEKYALNSWSMLDSL